MEHGICPIAGFIDDSATSKGQIAYFFFIAHARNGHISTYGQKYDVTIVFSDPDSPYKIQEFWRFGHKYGPNCIFFIAHARNGQISTFNKKMTSPSCSPTPISYKMQEFWRFGYKYGPNCIFFIAHAQNGLISTSCQKSDVTVVFPDPDFL